MVAVAFSAVYLLCLSAVFCVYHDNPGYVHRWFVRRNEWAQPWPQALIQATLHEITQLIGAVSPQSVHSTCFKRFKAGLSVGAAPNRNYARSSGDVSETRNVLTSNHYGSPVQRISENNCRFRTQPSSMKVHFHTVMNWIPDPLE